MIKKIILICIENRLIINSLLFFATVVVLAATMMPADRLGDSAIYSYDKAAHFFLFFFWTIIFGLFTFSRKHTESKLFLVLLAGSAFGIAVEFLQEISNLGRHMELADGVLDILGSFSAILVLYFIKMYVLSPKDEAEFKEI